MIRFFFAMALVFPKLSQATSHSASQKPDIDWVSIAMGYLLEPSVLIGSAIIIIPAAVVFYRKSGRNFFNTLNKKPQKNDERSHTIILLGTGGSGKTSVLSALFPDNEGFDPTMKTGDFHTYTVGSSGESLGKKYQYVYRVADISGQNLSSFSRGLVNNRKEFSHITALILVVDLVDPPGSPRDVRQKESKPNKRRVSLQKSIWTKQMMQVINGFLVKGSLRTVVLFINTIDCIDGMLESEEFHKGEGPIHDKIASACSPLIENINVFADDVKVVTILGSAKHSGKGIKSLSKILRETAVDGL